MITSEQAKSNKVHSKNPFHSQILCACHCVELASLEGKHSVELKYPNEEMAKIIAESFKYRGFTVNDELKSPIKTLHPNWKSFKVIISW